jgi:hypothetical protein
MGRRRIDLAAILAACDAPTPDDGDPWFVVALFPPPVDGEVRALWPNGHSFLIHYIAGRWDFGWRPHDPVPPGLPVGWKPPPTSVGSYSQHADRLPRPLDHGIRLM